MKKAEKTVRLKRSESKESMWSETIVSKSQGGVSGNSGLSGLSGDGSGGSSGKGGSDKDD